MLKIFQPSRFTSRRLGSYRGVASILNDAAYSAARTQKSAFQHHFLRTAGFATDSDRKHPADGPNDYSYMHPASDSRFQENKPTIEYAKALPQSFSVMRHEQIIQLCVEGSYEARREALIRNVMSIDDIEYEEAVKKVKEIAEENRSSMAIEYFPYQAGMTIALGSGLFSFPLIFSKDVAIWFNNAFVTTDVPDIKDLETIWEVGSWTWGWMEPALGQASFVLLVLQFARAQAIKLGIKPYGDAMLSRRSKRLQRQYPDYNAMFISWFAESDAMYGKAVQHD